jgi:AraC family transcriptional regulator of adaptative response/methylated-DNA-[protein]-cysteine methyltransferase
MCARQDRRWTILVFRCDDWHLLQADLPVAAGQPKNVSFHAAIATAERVGFRPCRRCNLGDRSINAENAELVAKACRLIDEAETAPSLAALAQSVELSESYFHRVFKSITGVTPKAYATARRAARVREEPLLPLP